MIGFIGSLDQFLFHLANGAWVSPMLDRLMPALSVAGNAGAVWLACWGLLRSSAEIRGAGWHWPGLSASLPVSWLRTSSRRSRCVPGLSRHSPTYVCSSLSPALTLSPPGTPPAPSPRRRALCSPRRGSWGGCRRGVGGGSLWPPPSPTPGSTSASTGRPTTRPGCWWGRPAAGAVAT